jgi:hypothetical protein
MTGGSTWRLHAGAAVAFLAFVLLGLLLAARRRGTPERRKARVSLYLAYALLVTFTAGLTQRDLWPFAKWNIKALTPPPVREWQTLVAVDAASIEHRIDYRAWQPLGIDELIPWIILRFHLLPGDAQDRVAGYLLERAEEARRAAREGRRVGGSGRFLGPLAAPSYMLHPGVWTRPEDVPGARFVALRIYEERWSIAERRLDPARFERDLRYEYRAP